jgi:hypothetical protein
MQTGILLDKRRGACVRGVICCWRSCGWRWLKDMNESHCVEPKTNQLKYHGVKRFSVCSIWAQLCEQNARDWNVACSQFCRFMDHGFMVCIWDLVKRLMDSSSISVETLFVSQNGLRSIQQLREYIEYVKSGGKFSRDPKIVLVSFEDGNLYVIDGHHRCDLCINVDYIRSNTLGCFLFILLEENIYLKMNIFTVRSYRHSYDTNWVVQGNFEKNNRIILEENFLSPFDIRTEVRLSNFQAYKDKVRNLKDSDPDECINYILSSKHLYCTSRIFNTVEEMVEALKLTKYSG